MAKIIFLLNYVKQLAKKLVTQLVGLVKGESNGRANDRNKQHGEKRRVVYGKDGVSKGRGRPRTKR